ncbi:MAG TPA: Gfo/Idh/MocA family oxidoreductase [Arachidicoccus sp.]|nr:Gfo/Idh/MocA family oxidoreductase [Arachidicoccus sp.]
MPEKIYNWGIIGPGKIAQKFANALKLTPRVNLGAVASRDINKAKSFAQQFDCPVYYDNYLQLVKDPTIDAIYIATPHAFHLEQTRLCLENGKAVLCEKPLTLSAAQVTTLMDIANQHQTFLMEAMWARFIPLTEAILKIIKADEIGSVHYMKADFGFPAAPNPTGRLFNPALGGGSLLDVGIYPIYLCTLLMGWPDKIHATGRLSEQGIDLDCHAFLQYKEMKTGVISSSIVYQTPITAEITGTKGQIQIPCPWYKNNYFHLKKGDGDWEKISLPPMPNGFEFEIQEVTKCLDEGLIQSSTWPLTSSLQIATIMDQIKQQIGVIYNED